MFSNSKSCWFYSTSPWIATTRCKMVNSNPPLFQHYGALLRDSAEDSKITHFNDEEADPALGECELPLIDLDGLRSADQQERNACSASICRASSEWGFFQVVNHGISPELFSDMRREQEKLFEMPFERKANCSLLNNSYSWGTPTASHPKQFSWSEAFHIPLTQIPEAACWGEFSSLRAVIQEYAAVMSKLSKLLAGILAENLGYPRDAVEEICDERTCFLRLNHYPACPKYKEVFGLVPHTDSDFLTILYQDQVGGLQLLKDSRWLAVKPNPDALIVNIGDLFQVWSNDVYQSVKHKVMADNKRERYSAAYFLCPSYNAIIGGCKGPSIYRKFTFGEYRNQIQEDVKKTGYKIGLPRFLLQDKC